MVQNFALFSDRLAAAKIRSTNFLNERRSSDVMACVTIQCSSADRSTQSLNKMMLYDYWQKPLDCTPDSRRQVSEKLIPATKWDAKGSPALNSSPTMQLFIDGGGPDISVSVIASDHRLYTKSSLHHDRFCGSLLFLSRLI